jgi:hypothetical protein
VTLAIVNSLWAVCHWQRVAKISVLLRGYQLDARRCTSPVSTPEVLAVQSGESRMNWDCKRPEMARKRASIDTFDFTFTQKTFHTGNVAGLSHSIPVLFGGSGTSEWG